MQLTFAGLYEDAISAPGTSRHFAALRNLVAIRA